MAKSSVYFWKEEAILFQENIGKKLGDRIWDLFEYPTEREELFQKIALALYGNPLKFAADFGLPQEKKDFVNTIIKKFLKNSIHKNKIIIGVIFVSVYLNHNVQTCVPLFRLLPHEFRKTKEDVPHAIFIDHLGRVYKGFSNYLADNTWERSYLYLPEWGYYESINNLDDGYSESCDEDDVFVERECINEFLFHDQTSRGAWTRVADSVSTYANIGTTIGMLGGLVLTIFPPTAPIGAAAIIGSGVAGAPGAAYGAGRSVEKIVDRFKHDQSISLADSEARQCWLITATAAASIGALSSASILTRMVKNGATISTAARGICTGINVTAVTLSGAAIANSGYEMCHKDEITSLDIFQFTTSLLFFTHSVVGFKTARAIIEEAQQTEIAAMKNSVSEDHHQKFDNILKITKKSVNKKAGARVGREQKIQGQAEFIKKMKKIENPNDYFQNIKITKKGNYCINNKLSINPKSYLKLTANEESTLLSSTKDLQDRKISLKAFNKKVQPIVKKHSIGVRQSKWKSAAPKSVVNNNESRGIVSSKINNLKQNTDLKRKNTSYTTKSIGAGKKSHLSNESTKNLVDSFLGDFKSEVQNLSEKLVRKIIELIVKEIENEIKRRTEQNSNPARPPTIKVEEFYQSQVTHEGKYNNLCESAIKLVKSCEYSNIDVPSRCLAVILEKMEGVISDATWSKNELMITCCVTSDSIDKLSFDFYIGNKQFVANIFKNGCPLGRPIVSHLSDDDSLPQTSNEDEFTNCCESLSDLAASCSEASIQIPEECLETIMEKSKGKIYNMKWSSNDFNISCTFLTECSSKMTIDFQISDKFFITKVYENDIISEGLKIYLLKLDDLSEDEEPQDI